MKPNDYIKKIKLVDTNYDQVNNRISDNTHLQALIHGALGLAGESGEVVDIIKKVIQYGKPLDTNKLKEELGDTLWYMGVIIDTIDSSFEEVMQMNVDKLSKRFPSGFSEKAAMERGDEK